MLGTATGRANVEAQGRNAARRAGGLRLGLSGEELTHAGGLEAGERAHRVVSTYAERKANTTGLRKTHVLANSARTGRDATPIQLGGSEWCGWGSRGNAGAAGMLDVFACCASFSTPALRLAGISCANYTSELRK